MAAIYIPCSTCVRRTRSKDEFTGTHNATRDREASDDSTHQMRCSSPCFHHLAFQLHRRGKRTSTNAAIEQILTDLCMRMQHAACVVRGAKFSKSGQEEDVIDGMLLRRCDIPCGYMNPIGADLAPGPGFRISGNLLGGNLGANLRTYCAAQDVNGRCSLLVRSDPFVCFRL